MLKISPKAASRNGLTKPLQEGKTKRVETTITITPPKMEELRITIRGDAPLVVNRFSKKAREMIRATQEAGHTSKKGKKREPKDFNSLYEESMYTADKGWRGIPAGAFRQAMVSACKLVGFVMTDAKKTLFIIPDGFDRDERTPLVRVTKGEPHYHEGIGWNANGNPDIKVRAMWEPGWEAVVRIRYDADTFKAAEVANLMARVGMQIGLLEGRPFSKNSCGCGWGTFEVVR